MSNTNLLINDEELIGLIDYGHDKPISQLHFVPDFSLEKPAQAQLQEKIEQSGAVFPDHPIVAWAIVTRRQINQTDDLRTLI